MNNHTIGEILAESPRMGKDSEIAEKMNRVIKKFDDYERVHGFCCALCPPEANWHPADEIFPDDEFGDLCEQHLRKVEEERELAEEEKRDHHK